MSVILPILVSQRWESAIKRDNLMDWCRLAELLSTMWADIEVECTGTEMADDLCTLSDVALERARMLIPVLEAA